MSAECTRLNKIGNPNTLYIELFFIPTSQYIDTQSFQVILNIILKIN